MMVSDEQGMEMGQVESEEKNYHPLLILQFMLISEYVMHENLL